MLHIKAHSVQVRMNLPVKQELLEEVQAQSTDIHCCPVVEVVKFPVQTHKNLPLAHMHILSCMNNKISFLSIWSSVKIKESSSSKEKPIKTRSKSLKAPDHLFLTAGTHHHEINQCLTRHDHCNKPM